MLMPLADFRAVGGFDEAFFMNAEEIDLQRRLRQQRGLPSVVLAEPVVTHLGGGSTVPVARPGLARGRADGLYADRWGGRGRLRAALGGATLVNLVWNLGRQVAGRDVSAWSTAHAELRLLRRNGTNEPG